MIRQKPKRQVVGTGTILSLHEHRLNAHHARGLAAMIEASRADPLALD
jgi:hypothetical protein